MVNYPPMSGQGPVWLRRTNAATRLRVRGLGWLSALVIPAVWAGYLCDPYAAVQALSDGEHGS